MTTELLFRNDAYLRTATARVVAVSERGIELDRTILYPQGGGQMGDTGMLVREDGERIAITDTRKGEAPDSVLHVVQAGSELPTIGESVALEIDWARRYALMRLHTALHVMSCVVVAPVTGGNISPDKARLDFDIDMSLLDAERIARETNALIERGVATATFDAKTFTAKIQGGDVGNIKLGTGDLLITGLDGKDQFIKVGGDIISPMQDALKLLDHERLGYASKLGLSPERSSGDVATHIQFDFPAEKDLTFAQVDIAVSAAMTNVGLQKAMFEQNVTDGNLELVLSQNGMRISGPLRFGGIPLDLQWLENFTDGAKFEQQIRAIGTVNADQRAAFGYETRPFFDGPSHTDLTYITYADGRGRIDATFDLTPSILSFEFAKWSKPAGQQGQGKLAVEMRDRRILGIPLFDVTAITHRKNPLWYATIEMMPPFDHNYLALNPEEGEMLSDLQRKIPEVKDCVVTPNMTYVVQLNVDGASKPHPECGKYVLHALWGA
jgi:hypothetical protein